MHMQISFGCIHDPTKMGGVGVVYDLHFIVITLANIN